MSGHGRLRDVLRAIQPRKPYRVATVRPRLPVVAGQATRNASKSGDSAKATLHLLCDVATKPQQKRVIYG